MPLFKKSSLPSADPKRVREGLTRGVERVYPTAEALEKELKSGRRLRLYLGIDPTGPTLHLGHVIPLLKLRQFQELGHEIIILYGGFTAQIGDPTDKLAARQPLDPAEITRNTSSYRASIGKILNLKSANVRFLDNATWSNKLKPAEILSLLSRFTVSQLLERDMFQERLKQGKEVHGNEFLYPVFQAYDAVEMDVDIQVGGTDQTFNMLAGRTLARKMKGKEKFVIATKLLADPSGKKMGKTEGNMVAFSDSPSDSFGKIMSWPDEMILSGFELCTRVPLSDIEKVKKDLESAVNPKECKLRLAEAVVTLLNGAEAAKKARIEFDAAFSEGVPTEFVSISLKGREVGAVLISSGVIASKSELRRLINEGAVTNLETGEKAGEAFLKSAASGRYRLGKHRFIKLSDV